MGGRPLFFEGDSAGGRGWEGRGPLVRAKKGGEGGGGGSTSVELARTGGKRRVGGAGAAEGEGVEEEEEEESASRLRRLRMYLLSLAWSLLRSRSFSASAFCFAAILASSERPMSAGIRDRRGGSRGVG